MIVLVWLLIALAVGGALAALVGGDPGYLLVAFRGATLETSLWFALLCVFTVMLALALLSFAVRRVFGGRARVAGWLRGRRAGSARARAQRGTMLLAEGRWREAASELLAAAQARDGAGAPLAHYLGAARAANALGDTGRRDDILGRASAALPEAAFVVALTRAELQQAAGEWAESVATLNDLLPKASRHPLVLRRLFDAHRQLGDLDAALELAPRLADAPDVTAMRVASWQARFAAICADDGAEDADAAGRVRALWRTLPKALRSTEPLLLAYVDALVRAGAAGTAEAALRSALRRAWHPSWVLRYGTLSIDTERDAAKRLAEASAWQRHHPDDAALLLTLGRLANATGDADAAEQHLQASLAVERTAATLGELARLRAAWGDHAGGNRFLEEALVLAQGGDGVEAQVVRSAKNSA